MFHSNFNLFLACNQNKVKIKSDNPEKHKKVWFKKSLSSILTRWSSGLRPCSPLVFLLSSQYLISGFSRLRQNVQRNSPLRWEIHSLIKHFNKSIFSFLIQLDDQMLQKLELDIYSTIKKAEWIYLLWEDFYGRYMASHMENLGTAVTAQ